jgi:gliding motility-associated-like protein
MRKLRLLLSFVVLTCAALQSSAQITVDFTANPRSGCGQLLTSFTPVVTSANPIIRYYWEFGDCPSCNQDATDGMPVGHIYSYDPNRPCFTVRLTVTDAAGNTATATRTDYVCVYSKPTAAFAPAPGNATVGCAPLTVQLIDQSVATGGSQIVAWQWSSQGATPLTVGNGTPSDPGIPNPTFTWSTTGTYAPVLTVTDVNGCKETIQRNGLITVTPTPKPLFKTVLSPNSCTEPHIVDFINETNTFGAPNVTYIWVITPVPPTTGAVRTFTGNIPPSQTFARGIYDVKLTATGGNGCTQTIDKPAYINVGGGFDFTFTPDKGCTGTTVTFTAPVGSSDWIWDFGDGIGSIAGVQNPTYNYPNPGCFFPKLIATLPGGCRSPKVSATPICVNLPPVPIATASPTQFCSLPINVNFTATAPTNPNITCTWDLANTSTPAPINSCASQLGVSYQPSNFIAGVANPTLTWTDEIGCAGTLTLPIEYTKLAPVFTLSKNEGCVPYVSLITAANAPVLFGSPNTLTWELDGAPFNPGTPAQYNFASVAPCMHDIKLIATNAKGCTESITKTVKGGNKPTAVLSFSPSVTCAQNPVIFNVGGSTSTTCPLDTRMILVFGDGQETAFTTAPITHIYRDTISYCRKYPILTVFSNGCASDTVSNGCIYIQPTIAKFEVIKDCVNKTRIRLNGRDRATPPPKFDGSIGADVFTWKITPNTGFTYFSGQASGDPIQAGDVTLDFTVPGTYTVVLTTQNTSNGCTQSVTKTIKVANPIPSFTLTPPIVGCAPLQVACVNTSTYPADIASYAWAFPAPGQGTGIGGPNPSVTYAVPGAYDNLVMTITDVNGCTSTASQSGIVVQGAAADFTVVPSQGCAPFSTLFTSTAAVFPPTATIQSYSWDFENNQTLFPGAGTGNYYEYSGPTDNTAAYNITSGGQYLMKHVVRVLLPDGVTVCKDSVTRVAVNAFGPVAFYDSPIVLCTGQNLPIVNGSAGTGTLTHVWTVNGLPEPTFVSATPTVSFAAAGTYILCDVVTDGTVNACSDDYCRTITVTLPVYDFSGTPLSAPCPPLEVTLDDLSTGLDVIRWEVWQDILDPITGAFISIKYTENGTSAQIATSQLDPFTFVVTEAGCYTVKLFGETASGCVDSLIRHKYVCLNGPSADLTVAPTQGCAPLLVTYNITNALGQVVNVYASDNVSGSPTYVHNTSAATDSQTHTYTQAGTYYPRVLLSDGLGCDFPINGPPITVDSASGWVTGPSTRLCKNAATTLRAASAVPGASFVWFPEVNGSIVTTDLTQQEITIMPLVTTTYTVTITDPNGCAKIVSIEVAVKDESVPILTVVPGNPTVCANSTIQLIASATQDGNPINGVTAYNWAGVGLSGYTGIINPVASLGNTNQIYTVTVTGAGADANSGGCTATATVEIIVISDNTDLVVPSRTICKGGSVTLEVFPSVPHTSPTWSPSIGLSSVGLSSVVANPRATQTYTVEVTTSAGCRVKDEVTVYVLEPGLVSAGPDKAFCNGTPVTLSGLEPAAGAVGAGGTIFWTIDNGTIAPNNILNPVVNTIVLSEATMTYTVDQCILTDKVTVRPLPSADINGTGGTICSGKSIQLNVEGFANFFTWTPSTGLSDPSIGNPVASPTQTTTYDVTGSLGGNCATQTIQVTVNVDQLPTLTLSPQNTTYFPSKAVQLLATTNANTILWTPTTPEGLVPNLNCYNCKNPVFKSDKTSASYDVLVTDANGCTNSAPVTLRIRTECDDKQIFVPTAFSPNGDGNNDVLFARGSALNGITIFRVFDRWGNLMFETTNINKGWDGMYQGKLVNPDVYVYYIEAPCSFDQRPIFKKGNVTVIR